MIPVFDRDSKTTGVRRERHLELDEICSSFENAWHSENRKTIEAYVRQVSDAMKPIVVRELVAMECELLQEHGDVPSRHSYTSRFADYSNQAEAGYDDWIAISGHTEASAGRETRTPDRLGDYRIVRQIGQGGMGIVYEAIQESLDRKVAIKTLATQPLHVPKSAHRFRRESRAIGRLHHTNIIHVYGSGVHDGIPYFAMQFIDGKSLDQVVDEAVELRKSLAEKNAADDDAAKKHQLLGRDAYGKIAQVGLQVANALQYAHENGVLHRDIKPSNLLIDAKGTTWVSDFGLAKMRREQKDQTVSGAIIGTIRYAPPETFGGHWNESGDVYSLGLTLYELVALEPAYPEDNHLCLIERITQGDVPKRLKRINPTIPRDLETIILKAISREQRNRYATAAELAADLQRFINGEPISARPVSATEKVLNWSYRRPLTASLALCLLVLVAIGFPAVTSMWLHSENMLELLRKQSVKTEIAKKSAISAQKIANHQRIEALYAGYGSGMQLAQKFIDEKRILDANNLLDQWNFESIRTRDLPGVPELVGWEWNFIRQQIDMSQLTLRGDLPYVYRAKFSPDDRWIATVHTCDPIDYKSDGRSEIIIWDSKTGQRKLTLQDPDGFLTSIAFSPDGSQCSTYAIDTIPDNKIRGYLRTWDLASGLEIQSKQFKGAFYEKRLTALFRPDTPNLYYTADGRRLILPLAPITVVDAKTMETLSKISGRWAIPISDTRVACLNHRQLEICDIETAEKLAAMVIPEGFRFDIGATHDSNLLSISSKDEIKLVEYDETETQEHRLRVSQELPCVKLYWGRLASSGNKIGYADYGGRVFVHKLRGEKWYRNTFLGHAVTVTFGDFSHDEKRMVTSSLDGTAKVWDLNRSSEQKIYETNRRFGRMTDFCFSPDGNRLNFICRKLGDHDQRRQNAGCFYYESTPAKNFDVDVSSTAICPRTDFAFSPDGKFLLAPMLESELQFGMRVPAQSGQLGIWFVEDWSLICRFDAPFKEITSVVWNRDLKTIAVAGKNSCGQIAVFNSQEMLRNAHDWAEVFYHEPLYQHSFDDNQTISAMAFDQQRLAVAREKSIHVFDWTEKRESKSEPQNLVNSHEFCWQLDENSQARFLDFAPDANRLAAAISGKDVARMYDLETGEIVFEAAAPRSVGCVRFSPNGRRFAMSGYDGLVYLCDAKRGHRLLNLSGNPYSPGTTSINSRVVFSSDGRKIATNNRDGEIVVWEAEPIARKADNASNKPVSTATGDRPNSF